MGGLRTKLKNKKLYRMRWLKMKRGHHWRPTKRNYYRSCGKKCAAQLKKALAARNAAKKAAEAMACGMDCKKVCKKINRHTICKSVCKKVCVPHHGGSRGLAKLCRAAMPKKRQEGQEEALMTCPITMLRVSG